MSCSSSDQPEPSTRYKTVQSTFHAAISDKVQMERPKGQEKIAKLHFFSILIWKRDCSYSPRKQNRLHFKISMEVSTFKIYCNFAASSVLNQGMETGTRTFWSLWKRTLWPATFARANSSRRVRWKWPKEAREKWLSICSNKKTILYLGLTVTPSALGSGPLDYRRRVLYIWEAYSCFFGSSQRKLWSRLGWWHC